MHQEEANAFILGIPWSIACIWLYNYISNKVDYKDQSYFGAILLAPLVVSGVLALIFSWLYIYKWNAGTDYGISPFDDWLQVIFPFFSSILSFLSTSGMLWGFWKLYDRYFRH